MKMSETSADDLIARLEKMAGDLRGHGEYRRGLAIALGELRPTIAYLKEENDRLVRGRAKIYGDYSRASALLDRERASNEALRVALERIAFDESCFEGSVNPDNWPHIVARAALQ